MNMVLMFQLKEYMGHIVVRYYGNNSAYSFQNGRIKVQSEISDFKDKLELAKETIAKFKTEIARVQRDGTSGNDSVLQSNNQSPTIGSVFSS